MHLYYNKFAHNEWSGKQAGCYLLMSALVEKAKEWKIKFDETRTDSKLFKDEEEMLRHDFSNKSHYGGRSHYSNKIPMLFPFSSHEQFEFSSKQRQISQAKDYTFFFASEGSMFCKPFCL